ncbi:MAG: S41 family peptidase [Anaerosomatales bacterium]|nr:S41 family peptidase [Anaerosomatales bacterium]
MNKVLSRATVVALAVSGLLLSFAGGMYVGRRAPAVNVPVVGEAQPTPVSAAREVRNIIMREALKPSSDESMAAGVAKGMLESLDDPYAMYFDKQHYKYFQEQTDGAFYGIGITISDRDGQPYVVTVLPGTPAERAGLKPDDEIVSIDGLKREKWDLDEVVRRIRGEEGTKVTLEIRRKGSKQLLKFTITRARIEVPNIEKKRIDGVVGYIRLYSFNEHSEEDLRAAIEELSKQGAKGFVLDLRDNPGGLLSESVDVLSLFVKDGVAVTVDARNPRDDEVFRVSGDTVTDAPLVVLVNENSASASEIVAGALQDYKRAVLVGVKTFGKGSVQQIEPLSFGGAVKLTIAHYLTPKGRSIDKVGVTPDVVVKMDPQDQADEAKDVQLKRAVEELKKRL